jgi:hypothetical protein
VAAVAAAPDAPPRGDRKNCELLSSRCILFAFVVRPSSPVNLYAFLSFLVEVRLTCSGQGPSPGGGDF